MANKYNMPEETPSTKTTPPEPAPKAPAKEPAKKPAGKWFRKIPTNILLSPGGIVLIFFALFMEILDIIPIPFLDQLWELPLEIVFVILLAVIAKTPLKTAVIPFLIERIPIVSDILPTWVIRMLA